MSIQGEDAEIQPSESKESQNAQIYVECDRKCLHHGDRICFNDELEKQTVKKIPAEPTSTETLDSEASIHSGESQFKTFAFDAEEQDPDMQKCMAFWTGILGKNVKPIKCTAFQHKKPKPKRSEKEPQKSKPDFCDDENTTKLWQDIYKDLQRRNLDKYKLVRSTKCDPCEYIDEEAEKKQDVKDIKNLNHWKTHSRPSKIDVQAQVQRTLDTLKKRTTQAGPKKVSSVTTEEKKGAAKVVSDKPAKVPFSPPPPTRQNSSESCSICGYAASECICDQIAEIEIHDSKILDSQHDLNESETCYPCECSTECVCEPPLEDKAKICTCGCTIDKCICDVLKVNECPCDCGVKDCLCQELFTRSCQCGHVNCDCDMIEILNTYLETLNTPTTVSVTMENDDLLMVSRQSQTDAEMKWVLETTQKPGSYCVICGHYNCYCKPESQPK